MNKKGQKDFFSTQANVYAAFRPTYPQGLYDFVFSHLKDRDKAWDCATGNGQVAGKLADYFKEVYATDISQQQLNNAIKKENIHYSVAPAEQTSFADHEFDLITVAQALHWFDHERFYPEVERVSKPGSLLAIWGYAQLYIEPAIDDVLLDFYDNIVGPYWDIARRLVEEEYRSLSFPLQEIETPKFNITATWSLAHLAGYLESWSATQKYIREKGENPVPKVIGQLESMWIKDIKKSVQFPIFLKLFKL